MVFAATMFLPRALYLEILTGVGISLSAGVSVGYFPLVWHVVSTKRAKADLAGDMLSIAIFSTQLGIVVGRSWSLYWRAQGQPVHMLDEWVWGYHLSLLAVGSLIMMITPGAIEGRIPPTEWLKAGGWVALGVFIFSFALIWFSWGHLGFD